MTDYQRIAEAISFIRAHSTEQPSLDRVADHIGLSAYHFQKLFKKFAGVSPKRFLQHITSEQAKKHLRASESILETSFTVGLSSSGRLHDLIINAEAVTPGEYKSGGSGLRIVYGCHSTPFGDCLLAHTTRGICRLEFFDSTTQADCIKRLHTHWPEAEIICEPARGKNYIQQIFFATASINSPLPLHLRGTNFQLKVWQALLNIPPGCVTSYGALAGLIGRPNAGRAVGTALGNNPVGYLIPCHRVLRNDGLSGGYRWGEERKMAILGYEWSHSTAGDR